jgi:soluble lytic murein transglycosylase
LGVKRGGGKRCRRGALPPQSKASFSWAAVIGRGYNRRVKRRRILLLLVLALVAGYALYLWREEQRERKFFPEIQAAAQRYDLDPFLLKAVIWRESRFNANARGSKGEIGLMQIQEIAAQEWADAEGIASFEHEHCTDPGTNTLAGAFYLGKLLKRYRHTDNPVPYALADYNAGRGNVLKWNSGPAATNSVLFIDQIGFASTKGYVKSVMRKERFFRILARFGLN